MDAEMDVAQNYINIFLGVSNLNAILTYGRAYAVSLAVQQCADLHQFTVALYGVVYHGGFHQEGVVIVEHAVDTFL